MNKSIFLFVLFICSGSFFSCVSHKKVTLFQNVSTPVNDTLYQYKFVYKIQPRDILYVSITSYNQKATDFFNAKTSSETKDPVATGYKVSDEGYITLPIIDSVYVKGITINEVQKLLVLRMKDYISDAYVLVDLANFHFTILGDVKVPGLKTVIKDKTTLIEALAMGGDFMDFANRKNVKIIRTIEGASVAVQVDFTDIDLMNSPYFYVMPNDVIYVEPTRTKIVRSNLSQVTLVVSLVSLITVILSVTGRI